jgi:hypothetical protein
MLVDRLRGETPVLTAELRPPRAELDASEGMDAWIDTYHAIRRLSRQQVPVFLTDSAVGKKTTCDISSRISAANCRATWWCRS